jgi:dienelactone hydrolase
MKTRLLFWSLLVLAVGTSGSWAAEKAEYCLWDLDSLYQVPKATWGEQDGLVREVYYEGEPVAGKPTRVFGYYATPAEGNGPFPAMVLVHGGGGTAFREWAELWANRGYAALAMDLAGCGPDKKRLPDGGPNQGDVGKYSQFDECDYRKMWTYHAIAAVIRGHSLLASREEVDAQRTGICGISWGGYLTCIAAGIDHRFKVAVPVYGCGFLDESSMWIPNFDKMTPELRQRWNKYFDPSGYLPGVECPIFFLAGTDDFAYPLDIHRKSYRSVPVRPGAGRCYRTDSGTTMERVGRTDGRRRASLFAGQTSQSETNYTPSPAVAHGPVRPGAGRCYRTDSDTTMERVSRTDGRRRASLFAGQTSQSETSYTPSPAEARGPVDLRIQINMPHGHYSGWAPKEIGLYVDSVLKNGKPLPRLGPLEVKHGKATASIENESTTQIKSTALNWTTDAGGYRDNFTKWENRQWHTVDATIKNGQISAEIPANRPITFFLEATDERGATVSTHYEELP